MSEIGVFCCLVLVSMSGCSLSPKDAPIEVVLIISTMMVVMLIIMTHNIETSNSSSDTSPETTSNLERMLHPYQYNHHHSMIWHIEVPVKLKES